MKRIISLICTMIFVSLFSIQAFALPGYESYTYSYNGRSEKAPYSYLPSKVIRGEDLGIGSFNNIADIVVHGDKIYVVDSGNSRIIYFDKNFNVIHIYRSYVNNEVPYQLSGPKGLFIGNDEKMYIADTGNARIVVLDEKGVFYKAYDRPVSKLIPETLVYKPSKIAADLSGTMYVIAENINQGIMQIDTDGNFEGFIGAAKVVPNFLDLFWKSISTNAQRRMMNLFVPTEYNNMFYDSDGFFYVTTSSISPYDIYNAIWTRNPDSRYAPVRRLNKSGDDILIRKGNFPPAGDIEMNWTGDTIGPSVITDVSVDKNGMYFLLDSKRGHIFKYSNDGNLLCVFGGLGNQTGTFITPSSIDILDNKIIVADSTNNNLTLFESTEYGEQITDAVLSYQNGEYAESKDAWEKVIQNNGNLELAYIGIGKAFLRQENYSQALKYFKLGNDRQNYSKAFKFNRTKIINNNFFFVILGSLLLIIIIALLTRAYTKRVSRNGSKGGGLIDKLLYSLHVVVHPFEGFWDLKHEKRGSLGSASIIIILLIITYIFKRQFTGFIINYNEINVLNLFNEIVSVILPFILWCIAGYLVSILLGGEGSLKDIVIATSYALTPIILIGLPLIVISNFMVIGDVKIYTLIETIGFIWAAGLMTTGMLTAHQYSMPRTITSHVLTVLGMAIIIFIALLFFNVIQQMTGYFYSVYREILFRS